MAHQKLKARLQKRIDETTKKYASREKEKTMNEPTENQKNLTSKKAVLSEMKSHQSQLLEKKKELETVPSSGDVEEILSYGQRVATEMASVEAQLAAFNTAIKSFTTEIEQLEALVVSEKKVVNAQEGMAEICAQAEACNKIIGHLEAEIRELKSVCDKHYSACYNHFQVPPLEIGNDIRLLKIGIFPKKVRIEYDMSLKLKLQQARPISEEEKEAMLNDFDDNLEREN